MDFKKICEKEFKGKLIGRRKCLIDGFVLRKDPIIFNYKKYSQQYKTMSPKEFLSLVPKEPFKNLKLQKDISKSILKKKPINPAYLDVDVDTCQILAHEGRNRAIASILAGINKYPVILFNQEYVKDARGLFGEKGTYIYTERKNKCKKFLK